MHTCKQLRAGECGGRPPFSPFGVGLLSRALRSLKEATAGLPACRVFLMEQFGARGNLGVVFYVTS